MADRPEGGFFFKIVGLVGIAFRSGQSPAFHATRLSGNCFGRNYDCGTGYRRHRLWIGGSPLDCGLAASAADILILEANQRRVRSVQRRYLFGKSLPSATSLDQASVFHQNPIASN
jgi:hypothetical protein